MASRRNKTASEDKTDLIVSNGVFKVRVIVRAAAHRPLRGGHRHREVNRRSTSRWPVTTATPARGSGVIPATERSQCDKQCDQMDRSFLVIYSRKKFKTAQKQNNFAKVDSKFCQTLNYLRKIYKKYTKVAKLRQIWSHWWQCIPCTRWMVKPSYKPVTSSA